MQIWAEPGKIGPAHSQLFTNLISVFNVYTKLETVSELLYFDTVALIAPKQ